MKKRKKEKKKKNGKGEEHDSVGVNNVYGAEEPARGGDLQARTPWNVYWPEAICRRVR